MTTKRVFISYSGSDVDREWVRAFARSLEQQGASVWFDETRLHPGDSIRDALAEGLRNSDIVVSLIDPNNLRRPDTNFEIGAALGMDKRLIAIVSEDLDPSLRPQPLRVRRYLTKRSPEETARALVEGAAAE